MCHDETCNSAGEKAGAGTDSYDQGESVMGWRNLRISVMGSIDTWWCVQERRWWGWKTISPYLKSADDARTVIAVLNAKS